MISVEYVYTNSKAEHIQFHFKINDIHWISVTGLTKEVEKVMEMSNLAIVFLKLFRNDVFA